MSAEKAYGKIILKEYIVTIRQSNKVIKKTVSAISPDAARAGSEVYGRVINIKTAPIKIGSIFGRVLQSIPFVGKHVAAFATKRLSANDRFQFFQTLSNFLKGYTVDESLRMMSENFSNPIKRVCNEIRSLPSGDFADQLTSINEKDFPSIIVEVIRANSKVTSLSETLMEAVRFERKLIEIKKQDRMGMYMAIGYFLGACFSMIGLWYSYPLLDGMKYFDIIPKEGDARDSLNFLLWISEICYIASKYLLYAWGAVAFWLWMGRWFLPIVTDRIILYIPVLREVMLLRENFLACYQVGVLVEKGIELKSAIEQVEKSLVDGALKTDFKRVLDLMVKGTPDWQKGFYSFSDLDRALLMSAGSSKEVAQVFQAQADQFLLNHRAGIKWLSIWHIVISAIFGLILIYALTIIMFLPAAGGLQMVDDF
jgi:type II secretory pathway component PulF